MNHIDKHQKQSVLRSPYEDFYAKAGVEINIFKAGVSNLPNIPTFYIPNQYYKIGCYIPSCKQIPDNKRPVFLSQTKIKNFHWAYLQAYPMPELFYPVEFDMTSTMLC